jgi:hypothetical protein
MTEEQLDVADLQVKNRRLRDAVHKLADAVDDLVDEFENQGKGQGPPEHAQNAKDKAQEIREQTPKPVSDDEEINPPWERAGYDSKEAWLADKE